jgi:hypothetical protein
MLIGIYVHDADQIGFMIFNTFTDKLIYTDQERPCLEGFKVKDASPDESRTNIGEVEVIFKLNMIHVYIHGYLEEDHLAEISLV